MVIDNNYMHDNKPFWLVISLLVLLVLAGLMSYVMRKDIQIDNSIPRDSQALLDGTEGSTSYVLNLENTSSYTLSPLLIVLHNQDLNLNFQNSYAPESFESLAELGEAKAFADYLVLKENGVRQVVVTENPLLSLDSLSIPLILNENIRISVFAMVLESNDAYVYAEIPVESGISSYALNYDAGFEENNPLGSGFEGGQPDPLRAQENVNNGTATEPQEVVIFHDQLLDNVLQLQLN